MGTDDKGSAWLAGVPVRKVGGWTEVSGETEEGVIVAGVVGVDVGATVGATAESVDGATDGARDRAIGVSVGKPAGIDSKGADCDMEIGSGVTSAPNRCVMGS